MPDHVSVAKRSEIMSLVRQRNTGPELAVRKVIHSWGYRFRLHRKDLPGSPDIVFPVLRKAIMVHGCFWHGHKCRYGRLPKSRLEYWGPKIAANRVRDAANVRKLRDCGWSILTVWQCELRNPDRAFAKISSFLK